MEKFFEDYYKFISTQFTSSITQKIINGFTKKRYTTFRVNTLKSNIDDVAQKLKEENIDFKKSSFFPNSYYFKDLKESKALKLSVVEDGSIYLQSFSSMIPAYLIEPLENEEILDITAAPGSKTTLLSALSYNKALIYANEKDKIRYERLKFNTSLLGCKVQLLNEDAQNLNKIFIKKFDKVLVDAPCSGEGRFLQNDRSTYSSWSEKDISKYSNLQKKILDSALKTLKDGGLCVYSTCTINKKENEEVIEYVLQKYQVSACKNFEILNNIPDLFIDYIYNKNIKIPVYRILPSQFFEGFTIIAFYKIKDLG